VTHIKHSQTIQATKCLLLNSRCIAGKAKLCPLCLSCMESAGFRFAMYKWFRANQGPLAVEQLLWNKSYWAFSANASRSYSCTVKPLRLAQKWPLLESIFASAYQISSSEIQQCNCKTGFEHERMAVPHVLESMIDPFVSSMYKFHGATMTIKSLQNLSQNSSFSAKRGSKY